MCGSRLWFHAGRNLFLTRISRAGSGFICVLFLFSDELVVTVELIRFVNESRVESISSIDDVG